MKNEMFGKIFIDENIIEFCEKNFHNLNEKETIFVYEKEANIVLKNKYFKYDEHFFSLHGEKSSKTIDCDLVYSYEHYCFVFNNEFYKVSSGYVDDKYKAKIINEVKNCKNITFKKSFNGESTNFEFYAKIIDNYFLHFCLECIEYPSGGMNFYLTNNIIHLNENGCNNYHATSEIFNIAFKRYSCNQDFIIFAKILNNAINTDMLYNEINVGFLKEFFTHIDEPIFENENFKIINAFPLKKCSYDSMIIFNKITKKHYEITNKKIDKLTKQDLKLISMIFDHYLELDKLIEPISINNKPNDVIFEDKFHIKTKRSSFRKINNLFLLVNDLKTKQLISQKHELLEMLSKN